MKKILTVFLCLLVSISLFANGTSEKTSSKGDVQTLEILLSDDSLEGGAMAAIVEKWNSTHEEFKVKINEIAYGDMKTQIMNRASVNELPALVKTTEMDAYADFLLPLDDTSLKQADFLRDVTRNGQLLATPINSTAVGMIVNKTAFDQAGVAYPTEESQRWTWDEFIEAVNKVVANSDCDYGIVIDHSAQRIQTLLYQFGMQIFDPNDASKIAFDSPETRKGLDFLLNIYDQNISPASVGLGTENAQSTFKTGKVAVHMSGNWVLNDYSKNITNFEWDPALMPYTTDRATCLGGNYLYAFKGTGLEKESKEFIEWFYQPENYSLYCSVGNYLPSKTGINATYTVKGMDIFNAELNATVAQPAFDEAVRNAHPGETYGNALRDAVDKAIAKELDTEGVIDYFTKAILDNYTNVSMK
ncbi:MAG: ABC transporter substrate-binding protein [Pleomorphochaeta sp.]